MISENMERLIKNLGCSYDALIANNLIDKLPLKSLYEDDDSLEIEPAPGIELIFWPETLRFEVIYIRLEDEENNGTNVFKGQLPEPFASFSVQADVHKSLGTPAFTKNILELQGTGLTGWDTYQVDQKLHPAALVEFQYTKNMRLSNLLFSLIDRSA